MEFGDYLRVLRRWLWLIVVMVLVGTSATFVYRATRPPIYRASTTILIGNSVNNLDPQVNDIRAAEELAQTYAQLVKSYDIAQDTVNALGLSLNPARLQGKIRATILPSTSLLRLEVTFDDPILVASIANELANRLLQISPNLDETDQQQIQFIGTQISDLETEREGLRSQLDAVSSQIQSTSDLATLTELNNTRNALRDQIDQLSSNIVDLTQIVTGLQARTNSLEVVETARVPERPSGNNLIAVLIGAVASAGVAVLIAIVFEYLNDHYRTADEVTQMLKLSVFGVISTIEENRREGYQPRLIINQPAFSRVVEEYNTLRANLLFSMEESGQKIFLLTSTAPGEGKSLTSVNLALSLAQTGKRVWLIDADLRRPKVHRIFNLPNEVGLTSLLHAQPLKEGYQPIHLDLAIADDLNRAAQRTGVSGLRVITSGFVPNNPNEILGSLLMKRLVKAFQESPHVDVVIFDTPRCLIVSDSLVLSGSTNARALLVVDAKKTRRNAALRAKERFQSVGQSVVGVVLNRADLTQEGYYGNGYGSYYASDTIMKITEEQSKRLR